MRSYSFYRQYHNYTGGHQKVADYIQHTLSKDNTSASLYLDNQSPIESQLFENIALLNYQSSYRPQDADVAFIAGMDWRQYSREFNEDQIKLNLIQHVRHGNKDHPLFQFLQHKAVRICVSDAVYQAIKPYANGPCRVIRMGHNIPKINRRKENDLYILGNKQPELAERIGEWAQKKQYRVQIHSEYVPKHEVLDGMASSKISLVLPNAKEGFYLPGIEAMALSHWAVVPHCVANEEYMKPQVNATQCELEFASCIHGIESAMKALASPLYIMKRWFGRQLAASYTLQTERKAYLALLDELDTLWK
ncbi:glycosyltransferase [Alteromonas sp. 5E99-2]|uniref:glycosyltransferase n=1 Tax=Alteromonas sp. 5E99-2 TaxID=2817683 RepID=UPI001A987F33|nr:glycosyltransferase [Alteromonas sp. 5E99-2]MBO1254132.1 glycosyltransferase [Alteromonas sp. 5E99-2]